MKEEGRIESESAAKQMFDKFSKEIKDSLSYKAPLTAPQIQAAATIYNRPIIVFNYAQKMAYFEKQYLPEK